MKIAACIDGQGESLSPQEPGILRLFAHEDGDWRHVSDTAFDGITARSIAEITQQAERLGALLDGAEALLVRDVKGIAVTTFTSRDVVRHPLVARIVDAYEQAEQNAS